MTLEKTNSLQGYSAFRLVVASLYIIGILTPTTRREHREFQQQPETKRRAARSEEPRGAGYEGISLHTDYLHGEPPSHTTLVLGC